MREITEETFLKDVSKHVMTIELDSGIHRHLHFANPTTFNQWFDIVTWPGYLAFTGDMGGFVFTRLKDMFEFFGGRPSDEKGKLYINLSYWAEKLEAVDRDGRTPGATQFSPELFRRKVEEHFTEWAEDEILTEKEAADFRYELEEQVLRCEDDGEYEARKALSQFEHTIDGHPLEFHDTWEWDFSEYTYRFTWCCYAIAWAIQQYNKSKVPCDCTSGSMGPCPTHG